MSVPEGDVDVSPLECLRLARVTASGLLLEQEFQPDPSELSAALFGSVDRVFGAKRLHLFQHTRLDRRIALALGG